MRSTKKLVTACESGFGLLRMIWAAPKLLFLFTSTGSCIQLLDYQIVYLYLRIIKEQTWTEICRDFV